MAEQRRNQRPTGGKPAGGKPTGSRPTGKSSGKPAGKSTGKPPAKSTGAPGSAKSSERSSRWTPDQDGGSKGRPARAGSERGGKPRSGGDRPGRKNDWKRPTDRDVPRTAAQADYDGPDLPEEITGAEIDRSVTAQLKGLPEKLASRVARHLGAAAMFIDSDPELAYQHALAARARAPRLAVVREATR